jgi:hypothetical protein
MTLHNRTLSVTMLCIMRNVVMLIVVFYLVMLNVVMPSVVVPQFHLVFSLWVRIGAQF